CPEGETPAQCLTQRSTASGVRPSLECFRRTNASAPPAESLPTPKNFFAKTSFTQRLPPLWDRTIFGHVFVRGGMSKFSKWKVPLPGGQARRNKLLVSWGHSSSLRPSRAHCSRPVASGDPALQPSAHAVGSRAKARK